MPFCPKCRYEYKPEISICPDCNERLVDRLPDKEEDDDEEIIDEEMDQHENWIELARLTSQQTAFMLVDILKSKDIPAVVISGTGHFGMTGQLGMSSFRPVGGGYLLMVPEEYAVDAYHEAEIVVGEDWHKYSLIELE